MKPKYAIFVMFVVMLFTLGMVAQTSGNSTAADSKSCCAHCNHASADMKDCCKDGKCCDMKDGKMACNQDCCKDMANGKSCCKDGKCDMAKAEKGCRGKSCKMGKKAA